MLNAGGIDYEEDTVQFQDWPGRKEGEYYRLLLPIKPIVTFQLPISIKLLDMPYLTLPVLYWDDEELGQSQAIARFIAKKVKKGLKFKNVWEKLFFSFCNIGWPGWQ